MAECSSSLCAICYRHLRDARLLGCFHSFCKTCVDDLAIRAGHDEISCPLCRSKTLLQDTGASGLSKDITVEEEQPCECQTCEDNGKHTKPDLWCTRCDVAYCKDHIIAHLLVNRGHILEPFAEVSGGHNTHRTTATSRHCRDHNRPLEYFCEQCDKTVCADCVALGEHHGHKPIVAIKEYATELKQRLIRKLDKLKTECLPRAQRAMSDVVKVTTELSSQAELVRTKIRSYRKSVLDAVELLFEQRLAEVDDLEDTRLKSLRSQEDELKLEADGLGGVLHFGEKMVEMDMGTNGLCDLLLAVNKRADEVENSQVDNLPVEHACLAFEEVNEDELLTKAISLVGVVLPCHASATHSFVQGDTKKTCAKGSLVDFAVVAKDNKGRRLAKGGDSIRAEVCQTAAEVGSAPQTVVLDRKDGTYVISVTGQGEGEYSFNVFVNNVKLQQRLSISCQPVRFTFNRANCQANSTISRDKLTVTHTLEQTGRNQRL